MAVEPIKLDSLTDREWDIVHTAYAAALETLGRFEETADRRVQLLLGTVSAAGVALGLAVDAGARATLWVAVGASFAVGLVGSFTLIRVARLIVDSQTLKAKIAQLGCGVALEKSVLRQLMVYDPYTWPKDLSQGWTPTRGGRIEFVAATTASAFGTATALLLGGLEMGLPPVVLVFIGGIVAIGVWYDAIVFVRKLYGRAPRHPNA